MDRRDELEQQIWEFVYGLLPEDEAAAVRRRIAAEPDVARLHDGVRRQAALLAEAAKLELPPIPLQRPGSRKTRRPQLTTLPRPPRPSPSPPPAPLDVGSTGPSAWRLPCCCATSAWPASKPVGSAAKSPAGRPKRCWLTSPSVPS